MFRRFFKIMNETGKQINSDLAENTATTPPELGAITEAQLNPEQIAELLGRAEKADEHWDKLLRQTADFENYKKACRAGKTGGDQIRQRSAAAKIDPGDRQF